MLECTGIPLPAESLLVLASLYASQTHHFSPEGLIIAAATGAIIGDNIGYLIGYKFGFSLLEKHGPKIGLNEDRLLLGRYLFRHFGGLGVLFGRFMMILRIFIALLAGASHMPWRSFLFYNASGGILWGCGYVLITYEIGRQIEKFSGPFSLILGSIAAILIIIAFLFLRRHERRLIVKARKEEKHLSEHHKKTQFFRKRSEKNSGSYDDHNDDNHH
ncbi:DedA family protein [Aristophania vespae]|uniref:DedA family protein n=1 Tax=Aristophania vespae TaxID=2697033 RepID=UPI0023516DD2|nr:DedA family protein [Aristophania vespae]UMM64025.1 putative membrane protein [Aristophania vespae]